MVCVGRGERHREEMCRECSLRTLSEDVCILPEKYDRVCLEKICHGAGVLGVNLVQSVRYEVTTRFCDGTLKNLSAQGTSR